MTWRLVITPKVQEALRTVPPETKRYVRRAFQEIAKNPWIGKPLRDDLVGLHSLRVRRFRVVYRMERHIVTVVVVGVGPRETIYGEIASALRVSQ